jgi:hypothetical protein
VGTSWISSAINAGEGFTMRNFRSKHNYCKWVQNNPGVNSAMILEENLMMDHSITVLNLQFTLTGNPYPSAIDLSAF